MAEETPIDLEHLAQFTLGDQALEAEVFSLFCEQTRMWLRALSVDADEKSWASAAHAIKGSARGVGAHALARACEAAEEAAQASPARRSAAAGDVRAAAEAALAFAERRLHRAAVRNGGL